MVDLNTGDYIAYSSPQMIAVWHEGDQLALYSSTGVLLDSVLDSGNMTPQRAKEFAMLLVDIYSIQDPQLELGL